MSNQRVVEKILDKWVGNSDVGKKEPFYLIQYENEPAPDPEDNDAWVHPKVHDKDKRVGKMIEEFDKTWVDPKKKNKPKNWVYAEELELEQRAKVEDWKEIEKKAAQEALNGANVSARRKTRVKQMVNYGGEGDGSKTKARTRRHSAASNMSTKEPEPPRGFARGREPEKILAATEHKGVMLYYVKWQGAPLADLCLETEFKKRFPKLVIQYLKKVVNLRDITEAPISAQDESSAALSNDSNDSL